jgi:hypothetical protein
MCRHVAALADTLACRVVGEQANRIRGDILAGEFDGSSHRCVRERGADIDEQPGRELLAHQPPDRLVVLRAQHAGRMNEGPHAARLEQRRSALDEQRAEVELADRRAIVTPIPGKRVPVHQPGSSMQVRRIPDHNIETPRREGGVRQTVRTDEVAGELRYWRHFAECGDRTVHRVTRDIGGQRKPKSRLADTDRVRLYVCAVQA